MQLINVSYYDSNDFFNWDIIIFSMTEDIVTFFEEMIYDCANDVIVLWQR